MNYPPLTKHYLALIEQAQRLGWSGEKAQNGMGPSLMEFWESFVTRLERATAVLNTITTQVGHPRVSIDEDPMSVADAVKQRITFALRREETLDHLIAQINFANAAETERQQQLPTFWRVGLLQIIQDARHLRTHQHLMEVPADSPTFRHLQRIEQEASHLLEQVNNPLTASEQEKFQPPDEVAEAAHLAAA